MKRTLLILSILFTSILTESKANGFLDGQGPIVRFYPNPATSVINFDLQKGQKGYTLQVYNFLGRKMFEQGNISDHISVNLTDFTRGVYIYQLADKTGRIVESGKFQVSK